MRILVFADIHGNLPAIELLLGKEKADYYVSLGDVVNYGPWSNECVDLVNSLVNSYLLIGNHEKSFLIGKPESNGLAGRFFEFCYPKFNRFDGIKNWREIFTYKDFTFQHTIDGRSVYPDSQIPFEDNYIIGHSHHQSQHQNGNHRLFAIGSVGQNRQFINRIDYMIFDKKPELKHLIYDESVVINEMKAQNYPFEFIDYYSKKARA